MSENKWDSSEYNRQMSAVRKAANAYNNWISSGLGRTEVKQLEGWADGKISKLKLTEAIKAYSSGTTRLNELYKTMKQYLTDYEDMVARAQDKMDNVAEVESVYGSFGNILACIGATTAAALAASKAYKFAESGKTFTADFNDMTEFMNSDVYKIANGFKGLSEVNNWGMYYETISSAITGEENEYVTGLLRSGLKSMVENIPGSEPVSFSNMDWDIIGAKLGIENLEDYMWPISSLMSDLADGPVSEDQVKALSKYLSIAKEALGAFKGAGPLITMLEALGGELKHVTNASKIIDACSELFANYFNTYADQISYLETLRESFEAAGYWTESPVMEQIDLLQAQYEDAVTKSIYYAWEEIGKEKAVDLTKEVVIKKIPLLKDVDTFFDVASKTSLLYGKDRLDAAQELMGYCQYDNMLTQTFEKYYALVESGAATTEEIAKTDQLYDMLQTLKIKEYEAMANIAKDHDPGWYATANDKLEELKAIRLKEWKAENPEGAVFYEKFEEVQKFTEDILSGKDKVEYSSDVGSSGGGRGGGGRRG